MFDLHQIWYANGTQSPLSESEIIILTKHGEDLVVKYRTYKSNFQSRVLTFYLKRPPSAIFQCDFIFKSSVATQKFSENMKDFNKFNKLCCRDWWYGKRGKIMADSHGQTDFASVGIFQTAGNKSVPHDASSERSGGANDGHPSTVIDIGFLSGSASLSLFTMPSLRVGQVHIVLLRTM